MASGTARTAPPPPPPRAKTAHPVPSEQFIEQQLDRTRRHLKLVDVAGAAMLLLIGVVAYVLAVVLIDHWILGLGFWSRLMLLGALLAGSGYYIACVLVPLLLRPINPAYAAWTIERSAPTLKNSLINFLLFRSDRTALREAIYRALETRAAADLRQVPLEHAVDRSRLIRIGYVLAAILALGAAYMIFSPKDPFQSIARLTAPWADIARPSRVAITDVDPGDKHVFQGETLTVSARVRGLRASEDVVLFYSTADRQIVDQPVAMRRVEQGRRYEVVLPPGETSGSGLSPQGIQQNVTYRIEAGDAVTPEFHLRAEPAPMMVVERVEYEYPAYTKRATRTVERGDISAPEGTRVTVHARSNQPIQRAILEFDPEGNLATSSLSSLPMTAEATTAKRQFALELKPDRKGAKYSAYHVRFFNAEGVASAQPVLHHIEVIRDLDPVVEFLVPETLEVEVPVSGEQPLEIRAVDPDYGLSRVTLRAVVGGSALVDEGLLEEPGGYEGQAVLRAVFKPAEHNLSPGDRVQLWATAEDNRTQPGTGQLNPNLARTQNYTLKIVADPAAEDRRADTASQGDPTASDSAQTSDTGQGQQADAQDAQGAVANPPDPAGTSSSSQQSDDSQVNAPGADEANPTAVQPDQNAPQQPPQTDDPQQDQQPSPQQQQQVAPADQEQSQQQQQQQQQQQGGGAAGGSQQQGGSSNQQQPNGGSGTSSGQSSDQQGEREGAGASAASDGQPSGSQQTGQRDSSASSPAGSGQPGAPTSNGQAQEDLHPGEVIEKINNYRERGFGEGAGTAGSDPKRRDALTDSSPQSTGQDADDSGASPDGNPRDEQSKSGSQPMEQSAEDPSAGSSSAQQRGRTPMPPSTGSSPSGTGSTQEEPPTPGQPTPQSGQSSDDTRLPAERELGNEPPTSDKTSEAKTGDSGQSQPSDPGAGQPAKGEQQASDPLGANADRPKSAEPQPGQGEQQQEATTPSQSKHQSDSTSGQDSGDRSGAGKQGSGQNTPQPGRDNPGSQTPSDQGAGAAPESGTGQTSSEPGRKQPAGDQTGQPGAGADQGSGQRPGTPLPSGEPADGPKPMVGAAPSESPPGEHAGGGTPGSPQPPTPGQPHNQSPTAAGGASTGGGGLPPTAEGPRGASAPRDVPDGDAANLEYARKATDLALEYLEDQKHNPDPKLLEELGWNQDDLQKFINQWQQLKQEAVEGERGRQEFDEALRSLGLRPGGDQMRQSGGADDRARGLSDDGGRTTPPPSFLEQFNAYTRGAARAATPRKDER